MNAIRSFAFTLALLLTACATVSTKVVELDPANKYPPTQRVEVLLQKPARPYVEIALLESTGTSEADMLNDAREKARQLGADAIVRVGTERAYTPPTAVYDPFYYDPFYWGYHRPYFYPPPYYPWGGYQVVGGYYSYNMKSIAIRYTDKPATAR
jgi:hypothetical protein